MDFGQDMDTEILKLASLRPEEIPAYLSAVDKADALGAWAARPESRGAVLAFFTGITGSETVSTAILDNALKYGVPPSLALALANEESRYDINAVNRNGDSVDRGLFQLNSKAFPEVKLAEVFDPAVSARYGLSHLAWFLETGGNEVAALAMYNAGRNRVEAGGTPRRTLDYIYRITSYRDNIVRLFTARVAVKSSARVVLAGRSEGVE